MKDEIKKILEMNKTGKITNDQATSLIDELMKKDADPANRSARRPNLSDTITTYVHNTIHQVLDGSFGGLNPGATSTRTSSENLIKMSRFESPTGQDHIFQGNQIHMSSVNDVTLNRSEMSSNRIDASKFDDLSLEDSRFMDNQISASSFQDFESRASEFKGSKVLGSKFSDFSLHAESRVDGLNVNGSSVKDCELDQSHWLNTRFNGAAVQDVSCKSSTLDDVSFQGVQFSDVQLKGTRLTQLVARAVALKDLTLIDCELNDVLISGGEGWAFRKRGFFDARLEGCRMTKVLFSDCHFADVVFRNVEVADLKIHGVTITDKVIDGTEAFLQAVGAKTN